MSQLLTIHPKNPQPRLIAQSVAVIRSGGIVVYPTDSSYALGCHIGNKTAVDQIYRIRQANKEHNFTLVCRDLSEIAIYAKVDNASFRLMKSLTPGPYTFILKATHEVPRRLQNPKRKTIGLRVPDHPIAQAILQMLEEPIMSSTLILPGQETPETEPETIQELLEHQVELVIDGGQCGFEPTTVIDLMGESPQILRQGRGTTDMLKQ